MKVSVYIATSLDGFIAREGGDLDWLPGSNGESDPELADEDFGYHDFMNSVDVLVMGRNTYEFVIAAGPWPYGDKKVIVLSSTLTTLAPGLPASVEISSAAPEDLTAELSRSGFSHIYIDGGKTIQSFLASGLVSNIIITRVPVLIGRGIPLFGPLQGDIHLQHLHTSSYANGFVQSRYKIHP